MKDFGENVKIDGMSVPDFFANLLERNEKHDVELERCKMSVSILKQYNNHCRFLLDIVKVEHKKNELEQRKIEFEHTKLKDAARTKV